MNDKIQYTGAHPQSLMDYTLFLDDERWPSEHLKGSLVICRNAEAFRSTIVALGYPTMIYFDNDLGPGDEGVDCAKWLLERIINRHLELGDPIPNITFEVHSQNPVAAKEIHATMSDIAHYLNRTEVIHEG